MMDLLDKARRYLWAFVELGFLAVLSIILVHLLMGRARGPWVTSVADNVLKFANGMQLQALVGMAIMLAALPDRAAVQIAEAAGGLGLRHRT